MSVKDDTIPIVSGHRNGYQTGYETGYRTGYETGYETGGYSTSDKSVSGQKRGFDAALERIEGQYAKDDSEQQDKVVTKETLKAQLLQSVRDNGGKLSFFDNHTESESDANEGATNNSCSVSPKK